VEPALVSEHGYDLDKPVSQEIFLEEFKKVALSVANRLKEQPVIVAHSESTFDGSGVKRLLSNKFELDKVGLFSFGIWIFLAICLLLLAYWYIIHRLIDV
jgi:hypothetical protein